MELWLFPPSIFFFPFPFIFSFLFSFPSCYSLIFILFSPLIIFTMKMTNMVGNSSPYLFFTFKLKPELCRQQWQWPGDGGCQLFLDESVLKFKRLRVQAYWWWHWWLTIVANIKKNKKKRKKNTKGRSYDINKGFFLHLAIFVYFPNSKVPITTLALGLRPRQGLSKVRANSEAQESHFMLLRM